MILINAINVKSGGGLTILTNLIEAAKLSSDRLNYLFLCPANIQAKIDFTNVNVKYIKFFSYAGPSVLYNLYFIKSLRNKYGVTVELNLNDIPSAAGVCQIMYFDWAYALMDKDLEDYGVLKYGLKRLIKMAIFNLFIEVPNIYICQTNLIASKLSMKVRRNKIRVMPPYPENIECAEACGVQTLRNFAVNQTKFFYPCNFYKHKNLEILVDVAMLLRSNNIFCNFILTLDKNNHEVSKLFRLIEDKNLANYFINVGFVDQAGMKWIYQNVDALIAPTLIETFFFPFVEALLFNLPILASDKDFARAVCGDYAIYFDPENADDIFIAIRNFINKTYRFDDNKKNEILGGLCRSKDLLRLISQYNSKT